MAFRIFHQCFSKCLFTLSSKSKLLKQIIAARRRNKILQKCRKNLKNVGFENESPNNNNSTNNELCLNVKINKSFGLMLNTVYLLGISPIYWDKTKASAKFIDSKLKSIHWKTTLSIIAFVVLLITIAMIKKIIEHGFQFTNMNFMFKFLTLITGWLSMLLHFHTAIRSHEMIPLINGLVFFWKDFKGKFPHDDSFKIAKTEQMLSIIIKICFYGQIVSATTSVPAYIIRCEFHMLADILPVCLGHNTHPYVWFYKHPFYFLFFLIIQFLWTLTQAFCIVVLVTVITPGILFSQAALGKLSSNKQATIQSKDNKLYIVIYRSLQIISERMGGCFSSDIWPSLIAGAMFIVVLAVPLSVQFEEIIPKVGGGISAIIIIIILWGLLDYASKVNEAAKKFVLEKKSMLRRKYLRKVFYSFEKTASFRVKVGPFCYISKRTVVIVLSIVFENIGALFILSKV